MAYERPSDSGVAVGTVLGVLIAIILLVFVVWLLTSSGLTGGGSTDAPSDGNPPIQVTPPAPGGGNAPKPQGFVTPSGAYVGLG
jgi:hypothetical protein